MRRFIFLLFFLSLAIIVNGQSWSFRHLTVKDGLSQNSVIDIVQDSLGFLWMATQDGLNVLNGTDIQIQEHYFTDITGEDDFSLGQLYIDHHNKLWLTNINGELFYFEADRTGISAIPEIKDASCVFHQKEGHHWIGTLSNGLWWIDEQASLQQLEGSENWKIHRIQALNGRELFICTSQGLFIVSTKTKPYTATLFHPNLVETNISTSSIIDSSVYVGTYGQGLYTISETGELIQNKWIPANARILDVLKDSQNQIWVATYGDGVYLLKDQELIQHFQFDSKDEFSINYNDILCLYEDQNQTIWLGTDGGGVSYFKQKNNQFNGLSKNQIPNDYSVDVVRAISVDREGIIWLGTSGKGLTSYHQKTKKLRTIKSKSTALGSDRIMSLWHDPTGDLYIGTQDAGLFLLDKYQNIQPFGELPCKSIWGIYPAPNKKIWLCTKENGLILFDPIFNKWESFIHQKNEISLDIRVIESLNDTTYFVGTQNAGVLLFNQSTKQFSSIVLSDKLTSKQIGSIKDLHLKDSILWIGTQRSGLIGYNILKHEIAQLNTSKGLPNNVVYAILEDQNGYFWVSTNKGICQVDPQKILANKSQSSIIAHYLSSDGLVSDEFNTGAGFQRENTLFFGGLDGFNWFDPANIHQDTAVMPIVLLDITYTKDQAIYKQSLVETSAIELQHYENNFQIRFSALQFPFADNLQYQYQLEGFQEGWVENNTSGIANFSNIPSGDYQFLVRIKDNLQPNNNSTARLSVHIHTPWYQRLWAYGIYLFLLATLFYYLYAFQKKRWVLQKALQEQTAEKIRLQELDRFKTKVFTNISHEIRTPLTLIKGVSNHLKDSKTKQTVTQNTAYLLDLTNNILDLSKLEAGLLKPNYIQSDIIAYLKILCTSFESLAENKGIELTFRSDVSKLMMDYDPQKIKQIVSNLIANAIKWTAEAGSVECKIINDHHQICCTIKDSGIGISEEHLPFIFDRYYQASDTSKLGTGIGLSLVKELILLLNGTITVDSKIGEGTTFRIQLPIQRTAVLSSNVSITNISPRLSTTETVKSQWMPSEKLSILIVEDNIDIANYIASCIEQDYHFQIAGNGKAGLEMALKSVPDIVISDVMMPEMNGFELCQYLKTTEITNHIPVILLTAKATHTDKLAGLQQGADAYLIKPFEVDELLVRIQQLVLLRQTIQAKYAASNDIDIERKKERKEDAFLHKINEILNTNLQKEGFDITFLCTQLQISRMQLHRKLKALTNQTTTQYINAFRLRAALPLLRKGELTVSEVAYQVGFNDPNYFSRCFIKEFGVNPSKI